MPDSPLESRHFKSIPAEGGTVLRRGHGADYRIDESGCWLWLRGIDAQGYGRLHANSGHFDPRAHREYYKRAHGPIREGWHVHHRCGVRACVNPDHLEATSPTDHFLEHKLREKTSLTLEDIREIRRLSTVQGVTAVDVAKRYGVHEITVYDYWSSNHWAEILGGEHAGRPLRTCPECGEDFDDRRRNAKFCCAEHRKRWNTRRANRRRAGTDLDRPVRSYTRRAA